MARFRTRARAVDMLGRQQIAGIPTAISELLKNAHDAYADKAEVDFIRPRSLFVLRDDGIGMDRDDFEGRWLTLGTESKLGDSGGMAPPRKDRRKPERPVLGEKGIGRLAIGAIGPQVLVLTRPSEGPHRSNLIMGFVNWSVFAIPGVDLEELEVPVWVLPGGSLPDFEQIEAMLQIVRDNLSSLGSRVSASQAREITGQLDAFDVSPSELDEWLGGMSLSGQGHGTHFFVQPTDPSLVAAIDGPDDDQSAPLLIKMLLGFSNTMTPEHPAPRIQVAFRDRKSDEVVNDLILESEFFTPREFANADHHIRGSFDEFGQFRGRVTVYGEPTADHVVPWPAKGRKTDCGPFKINLAVVQGNERESTLPDSEWALMVRKMNRIGGLYIYKDGIRVLPYGNTDYDFLDIERNRTKSASYYYFSFRRMFGVVEIDSTYNAALTEKAGREGFRENAAYRQFRDILKNFFVQIAADFFRPGGTQSGRYETRRAELDSIERARRKRDQLITNRRSLFRMEVESVLSEIRSGEPDIQAAAVVSRLKDRLNAATQAPNAEDAAQQLISAEEDARRELAIVREHYRIAQPRGVGLTKQLRQDFEFYRDEYERLSQGVFAPAELHMEAELRAVEASPAGLGRQVRFERGLWAEADVARKSVQASAREMEGALTDLRERTVSLVRAAIGGVDHEVDEVLASAASLSVSNIPEAEFVTRRLSLEQRIQDAVQDKSRVLDSVASRLQSIEWEYSDGAIVTDLEIAQAAEEELLELRERSEVDIELAQLGMAVQVINHEFDATIRAVRSGLRELNAWAEANDSLRDLHDRLRASFDHLDGYLTLFTPLQRRLYRRPARITGADIHKFVKDLFDERLRRESVALQATPGFRRFSFSGYPSTFYPVFVNLVDNALYWLATANEPRSVTLGVEGQAMTVANTGPAISVHDRERIFELGFTRKPSGRGIGLYIARDVLAKEGYVLRLADPNAGPGVKFVIEPAPVDSGEDVLDKQE
jgi:signal transduction histidine kinase